MRKRLLLTVATLALSASVAAAAGINLSWNDCGLAGAANKAFACNTNAGVPNQMFGSYIPPAGTTGITAIAAVIDLQSAGATLPNWWQFKNTGTCRTAALSADFNFVSGPYTCVDYFGGGASGSVSAYQTSTMVPPATPPIVGANRARIKLVAAIAPSAATPVDALFEYYGFRITITNIKTVGTGLCAGCLDPVCLILNEIQLSQAATSIPTNYRLQTPADRNFVTWQGGVIGGGCPSATPTRNATWGSVKSLYR